MLLKVCQQYQIDIILLNETNTKWTSVSLNKMKKALKSLGRELIIIGANSATSSSLLTVYLPGGLLTIIRGKSISLL